MAEEKKEAPKKEPAKKLKAKYKVMVTGFYALGKMFRSGDEITLKEFEKQIPSWLKEGKIA